MHESLRVALSIASVTLLGLLSLFALHRLYLVYLLVRHRAPSAPDLGERPLVTVQVPLYNEPGVAARTLEAIAALDWPRKQVQVIDDSTDETPGIVEAKARELGLAIEHIRRGNRDGWKAGALAHGLRTARGELVAIFDADFAPARDFLARTVPFFADPRVGLVQARWEHANRNATLLTRLQALLLDGHFLVEQAARSRSGQPFKFNGTAGVWRRSAIEDAGGWSADTLTEDLDLSVRAQLRGWRFVFVDDVVAEGELPEHLPSYRSQQRRWVKGSAQTARKLLGSVLRSNELGVVGRLETAAQLVMNACYPLALALALLSVPLVALGSPRHSPGIARAHIILFFVATANVAVFLIASQVKRGWRRTLEALVLLPGVFALGLGLSLSNARAFFAGLLGWESPFVRTPKRGARDSIPVPRADAVLEIGLAAYFAFGTFLSVTSRRPWATLPFQLLLLAAFAGVGLKTLTRVSTRNSA